MWQFVSSLYSALVVPLCGGGEVAALPLPSQQSQPPVRAHLFQEHVPAQKESKPPHSTLVNSPHTPTLSDYNDFEDWDTITYPLSAR